jgi:hypothetical protein
MDQMTAAMRGVLVALIASLASNAIASQSDTLVARINEGLAQSGSFRVRYFDPEISTRTIYDQSVLGDSDVDYDIRAKCFVTCKGGTWLITHRLEGARLAVKPCEGPPHMEIDFTSSRGLQNELSFLIDYSGTCMTFRGKAYILPTNLIWELHAVPVEKW